MLFYILAELIVFFIIIYIVTAVTLIFLPAPPQNTTTKETLQHILDFLPSTRQITPSEDLFFDARDGSKRLYRLYGNGRNLLIFFHGSTTDSRYLAKFAKDVSEKYSITVATLDMRGHGPFPGQRGDVDYIGQQIDDIVDLITVLGDVYSFNKIYVGGHDSGGGLALRYAASGEHPHPSGIILVCSHIDYRAETARKEAGGWMTPNTTRFLGIRMLNRIGIKLFNGLTVLNFSIPEQIKDGTETSEYSWSLYKSITLNNWQKDIANIPCPILVIAADNDTIMRPEGYREVFAEKEAPVITLKNTTHFGAIMSEKTSHMTAQWISEQKNIAL